jgi:hypothetical protein
MEPQLMMLAYQVSPTQNNANKIQSAHIQLIIYIYI